MPLEIDGFILTENSYSETSKIINILTKEYGIIGIMCKGAKSIKSKNRVSTMKYTYARFNIIYKQNKLSILVSSDIINPLKTIKNDIYLMAYISYLSDLTYQVIKQNNNSKIYDEFINTILKLNDGLDPLVLTNILEIKYLEYLGVLFSIDKCAICGSKENIITIDADYGGYICKNCYKGSVKVDIKTLKMLRMYYLINISSIRDIKVDEYIKNNINKFLDMYYDRYTGLYLNSKEFLKKIIN